jgi:hypothetical protein
MQTMQQTYLDLFEEALLAEGDEDRLRAVRENAAQIFAELQSADEDRFEGKLQAIDSGWIAKVYAALAREDEYLRPGEIHDDLFEARQTEETDVGRAFEQVLIVNVPPEVLRWAPLLALSAVSAEYQSHLMAQSSVQESPYARDYLVRVGLTPMSVLWTTDAIGGLIARLIDKHQLDATVPIILSEKNEWAAGCQHLDFARVVREVCRMADLPELQGSTLARWCIRVSAYKPLLFRFLCAKPLASDAVKLEWTGADTKNLYERWSQAAAARAGAAGGGCTRGASSW